MVHCVPFSIAGVISILLSILLALVVVGGNIRFNPLFVIAGLVAAVMIRGIAGMVVMVTMLPWPGSSCVTRKDCSHAHNYRVQGDPPDPLLLEA